MQSDVNRLLQEVGREAKPASRSPVDVDALIHPRERLWGTLAKIFSIWLYFLGLLLLIGFFIAPIALLSAWISGGIHKGALRSHGIKVSDRQFPEIWEMAEEYATRLNMQTPEIYIVNHDGLLNAFAQRFHSKDLIVLCSDVVDIAYEHGEKELGFVLAHELAHVKLGHLKWRWLHSPAFLMPFLSEAYSRGCEYSCDRIAQRLVPEGALFGLVSLCAGTKLYSRVDLHALYDQQDAEWDFWTWFHEIGSTHPNLVNRITALGLRDETVRQAIEQRRNSSLTKRIGRMA